MDALSLTHLLVAHEDGCGGGCTGRGTDGGGCICITMDTTGEPVNPWWVHPLKAGIYQTLPLSPGAILSQSECLLQSH